MGRDNGINDKTGIPYWKERRAISKEKVSYEAKKYKLRTYGLTEEAYEQLISDQDGRCAVCLQKTEEFCVDHNHQTEKVRGLLCKRCNTGLGWFRDNAYLINRAHTYLAAEDNAPTKASDVTGEVPENLKDYSKIKIKKDSLMLSGDAFFKTLQGEGVTMGLPCVFVRLHHCNLHCDFCDAYYTWKRDSREFWIEPHTIGFEDARDTIVKTANTKDPFAKRVIWTGGEPLIQRRQIEEVVNLLGEDWAHEIETNGTLMPTKQMLEKFQFNCSPKLANNVADRSEARIRPKILTTLNGIEKSNFKFVCRSVTDLIEIEKTYLPYIDQSKIIIMPEGVTNDKLNFHLQNLYEPCMRRGWRLMGRLQAQFADGARRAV